MLCLRGALARTGLSPLTRIHGYRQAPGWAEDHDPRFVKALCQPEDQNGLRCY